MRDAHTGPAPPSASGDAVVCDSDSDSDSAEHIMRHAIAHDAMKQQLDVASAALGWTLPGSVTNMCGGTITDTGATFTARYNVCSTLKLHSVYLPPSHLQLDKQVSRLLCIAV